MISERQCIVYLVCASVTFHACPARARTILLSEIIAVMHCGTHLLLREQCHMRDHQNLRGMSRGRSPRRQCSHHSRTDMSYTRRFPSSNRHPRSRPNSYTKMNQRHQHIVENCYMGWRYTRLFLCRNEHQCSRHHKRTSRRLCRQRTDH